MKINLGFGILEVRFTARKGGKLRREMEKLILAGEKIEAIKLHRTSTGSSLKDANDVVQSIKRDLRLS